MTDTTHVALLRGINVGSSRRLTMAHLREMFRDLGHPEATTYLQSGNVMFSATPADADRVAAALTERIESDLAIRVQIMIRRQDEIAAVVAGNPLPHRAADPQRLLVAFLSGVPHADRLARMDPTDLLPEEYRFVGAEVYLWCPEGFKMTQLSQNIWDRQLGVSATIRNWNTVSQLATR